MPQVQGQSGLLRELGARAGYTYPCVMMFKFIVSVVKSLKGTEDREDGKKTDCVNTAGCLFTTTAVTSLYQSPRPLL